LSLQEKRAYNTIELGKQFFEKLTGSKMGTVIRLMIVASAGGLIGWNSVLAAGPTPTTTAPGSSHPQTSLAACEKEARIAGTIGGQQTSQQNRRAGEAPLRAAEIPSGSITIGGVCIKQVVDPRQF
jgi:hypothetical protein